MPKLSHRGATAPPSPIRKLLPLANAARERGLHVYHVNIGQPDLPTPAPMRQAVAKYTGETYAYSPAPGDPKCRAAFHDYFCTSLGIDFDLEDILVTTGGSEAIQFALGATVNPGETVLIPEPLYPNYLGYAKLLGIEVAPIPCSLDNGYHLPENLSRFVVPGTRAILFANPGNPTGTVYRRDELEAIARLAEEHDLYVIADEVYRELIFSGTAHSILQMAEIGRRGIVIDSLSKRFSACGIRVGAMISRNPEIMDAVGRFAMARLSPPAMGQIAAAAMSEMGDEFLTEIRETYRRRRDVVVAALRAIPGVTCYEPEGALYTMARLPVADAEDFARFLLTSFDLDGATTMVAPGNGFYQTPGSGENELRVAFVLNENDLLQAIKVIGAGLTAYQQRLAADSGGTTPA